MILRLMRRYLGPPLSASIGVLVTSSSANMPTPPPPGLKTCCCPCIVFGKTQTRLEDPSLQSYNTVNATVRPPSPPLLLLPGSRR